MPDAWEPLRSDDPQAFVAVSSPASPAPEPAQESRAMTDEEWKRSIESARAQANAALRQIRTAVAARFPQSP